MFRRVDEYETSRILTDESLRGTGEGAVATCSASKPKVIKTKRQGRRTIVAVWLFLFQSTNSAFICVLRVPSATSA